LAEPAIAQAAALFLQELGADAREAVGGDFDGCPVVAAGGPGVVEEPAFAVGVDKQIRRPLDAATIGRTVR